MSQKSKNLNTVYTEEFKTVYTEEFYSDLMQSQPNHQKHTVFSRSRKGNPEIPMEPEEMLNSKSSLG